MPAAWSRGRAHGTSAPPVVLAVCAVVLAASGLLGLLLVQRAPGLLAVAPPVPADAASAPLRQAPSVPDPGGYVFLETGEAGEPVRWDPCRPVHVVVRAQGEPPGGREAVTAALHRVGEAAGLVFVLDGETQEGPAAARALVDRDRYGDRWAPVLLSWSDAQEYPGLAGALGTAGPARSPLGDPTWVSGTVALDRAWFAEALEDPVGRRRAEAVLVHELGHLVGLDHSADPFSVMSPTYQQVVELSLSDRAGLARLGGGPCAGPG